VYSSGAAEEILDEVLVGRRDRVLVSTEGSFRVAPGANDTGSSRGHLVRAIDASLRRLRTDHVDLYQLHRFDAWTLVEEVLGTLDDLVKAERSATSAPPTSPAGS
jgi:aryl-alcohol dehydrogenase-like predicted oxidoreductase